MPVVNISAPNDADFYHVFFYKDTEGVPYDLTGASFVMKARRQAEHATAFLVLSSETGEIDIVDAAGGSFTIMIPQQRLLEMPLGEYVHSLVMTHNDLKTQVWSGSLNIEAGASR